MVSPDQVRRVPRFSNWIDNPPSFEGMHGPQEGRYILCANTLDRLGKKRGGGLVGTFRDLQQAQAAAQAMRADHKDFAPMIQVDPEDRFANHDLQITDLEAFRREYHQRRTKHYQSFEGQQKISNPFNQPWPGQDPAGPFTLIALRLDLSAHPRQSVARFTTEDMAFACYDRIFSSNPKWEPSIEVVT